MIHLEWNVVFAAALVLLCGPRIEHALPLPRRHGTERDLLWMGSEEAGGFATDIQQHWWRQSAIPFERIKSASARTRGCGPTAFPGSSDYTSFDSENAGPSARAGTGVHIREATR
ncbi:hypothetical protein B0H11DRAFT_1903814 [Mycena galericulata]|nr:hypothetical protein B0H11DRAFT_1903814 [Mycena galericulata]